MIYNVSQIINKHSLPVIRGNQSVKEFLAQYYKEVLQELSDSTTAVFGDFPKSFYQNLKLSIIPKIREESRLILGILEFDQKHQHIEKRKKFNDLMQLLEESRALRVLEIYNDAMMIRIRQGEGPFDKSEFFHIPYSQRHLVSSQRYSIPGDPCLYLSVYLGKKDLDNNMLKLSWMESGMPKVFNVCQFKTQEKLTFLHLAKKGSTYLKEYNEIRGTEYEAIQKKNKKRESIEQYLLTLPLRIACSISIENKFIKSNVYYYEEYVLSQLLMEWVQQNCYYDGVTYQTALGIQQAQNLEAYNVAIPIRDIDPKDGYDRRVKEVFILSTPQKIDIFEKIKNFENRLSEVFKYAKKLEKILVLDTVSESHPYQRLLTICNSFFSICSELKKENDFSVAFPFQQLNVLCSSSFLICKTINNAKTAKDWVELYKDNRNDTVLTSNDYNDILIEFKRISAIFQELKLELYPKLIVPKDLKEPYYGFTENRGVSFICK